MLKILGQYNVVQKQKFLQAIKLVKNKELAINISKIEDKTDKLKV